MAAVKELSINTYVRFLPQSVNSVISKARKGDLLANKQVQEACGITGGKGNQTVNVGINTQEPDKAYDNPQEALKAAYMERDRLNSVIATLERVTGKVEVEAVEVIDHAIHPEQVHGGGA